MRGVSGRIGPNGGLGGAGDEGDGGAKKTMVLSWRSSSLAVREEELE